MPAKKEKPSAGTFGLAFDFGDNSAHVLSLEEVAFKHLRRYALMFGSGDPELKAQAIAGFREVSKALAKSGNEQLWLPVQNKKNASKPRPNSLHPDAEEIRTEFDKLVRGGFTEREARGRLYSWGRWPQRTVYRHTTKKK